MIKANTVDEYIRKSENWQDILQLLRQVCLQNGLEESMKWGMPTYTYDQKNIIGIGSFKNHVSLWFHTGGLLSDPQGILINAQAGKTKGMRQLKFSDKKQVNTDILSQYIREAIKNQQEGKKISVIKQTKPLPIPEIMMAKFNVEIKSKFDSLSLAKRNEYVRYINEAKRESTKLSRIEKIIPFIMAGKGFSAIYGGKD